MDHTDPISNKNHTTNYTNEFLGLCTMDGTTAYTEDNLSLLTLKMYAISLEILYLNILSVFTIPLIQNIKVLLDNTVKIVTIYSK